MAENTPLTDSMSLLGLEDELTCSICLSLFEKPVSLMCGHSFCSSCLEATWCHGTNLFCPHCRMEFSSKPDLKHNTVLSAVLDAYRVKAGLPEPEPVQTPPEEGTKNPDVVKCDYCAEGEAVKTCLTCVASYCALHVRPHMENAIFRAHKLAEPLPDLLERLCSEHSKLLELFCTKHSCCICNACLQFAHKGCEFITTEQKHDKQKSSFADLLDALNVKIDKNQKVIVETTEQQIKLQGLSASRKQSLESEYRQIREMIDQDEKEAMRLIDKEEEKGQNKLASMIKKFNENIDKMNRSKSEINNLLDHSHSLKFLKVSVDLPSVVNFDPYCPRMNVDGKEVKACVSSTIALKEWITKYLDQPAEKRSSCLRSETQNPGTSDSPGLMQGTPKTSNSIQFYTDFKQGEQSRVTGHHPGATPQVNPSGAKQKSHQKINQAKKGPRENKTSHFSKGVNPAFVKTTARTAGSPAEPAPVRFHGPPLPFMLSHGFSINRSDLLKHGVLLNFNVRTAHKRISLSENNTKATVSDHPTDYPDCPTRFSVCSQLLCTTGFTKGQYYWEIRMSSNNFCGLGLAYGRIDRKGPCSRLGRNAESWCVEWFNVKLSAWHNSIETVLVNPNPSLVGILLDIDAGSATFYNIHNQEGAQPFYTFVFPFSEAVYPAFWLFSNGSHISLPKLSLKT